MTVAFRYDFRPATRADLECLRCWLNAPHLRAWGDDEDPRGDEEIADPRSNRWAVWFGTQPFSHVRDHVDNKSGDHPFNYLLPVSRGIDQNIRSPNMIGDEHGLAFSRPRVHSPLVQRLHVLVTEPLPDNHRVFAEKSSS